MPKVILIGAGRGSRLMPLTTSQPKSFTPILSKRILDWTLEAFRANNLDDFVFISGYLKNVIEAEYPNFTFAENMDWENNNILFSLLTARDHLKNGFYATYTDTLFQASAIASLKESTHDITLIMDTEWRKRYKFRSQHPESDGEKMITKGDQVIRISREIDPGKASGEFTGVIKMTKKGAQQFLEFFDRLHMTLGPDGNFDESKPSGIWIAVTVSEAQRSSLGSNLNPKSFMLCLVYSATSDCLINIFSIPSANIIYNATYKA